MHEPQELERLYACHATPARDVGSIDMVVVRVGSERHETPSQGELTRDAGLVGDRWSISGPMRPDLEKQLTLMMTNVARVICGDRPLDLPGDNLLVNFDLSTTALPAGSRLRVGTALIEVTPKPHTGCKKFLNRFGAGALSWVNDDAGRARRLRGANCRVIESGIVRIGDTIRREAR